MLLKAGGRTSLQFILLNQKLLHDLSIQTNKRVGTKTNKGDKS